MYAHAAIVMASVLVAPVAVLTAPRPAQSPVFIENLGQWPDDVAFMAAGDGVNLWVTQDGLAYDHYASSEPGPAVTPARTVGPSRLPMARSGHVVRLVLVNAAPAAARGEGARPGYYNYFLGNDPTRWAGFVTRFESVRLVNVYDGIDMLLHFDAARPRFDFVISPGADPAAIALRCEGADAVLLDGSSALVLQTSLGAVIMDRLSAYQLREGNVHPVACSFALAEGATIHVAVGDYDRSRPLIIDPVVSLAYSTFIGGSGGSNRAEDVLVDGGGNAYVTGRTTTPEYPTTVGAYDESFNGPPDVFVSKLAPLGGGQSDLLFSTFIGGDNWDYGYGLSLDGSDNIYVAGITMSGNYPFTSGAYDESYNGAEDAFISVLDSSGSELLYSTFVGTAGRQDCYELAVDANGNAWITGMAWWQSGGVPTTAGAYDTSMNGGSEEAFLIGIAPQGNGPADLVYGTYLGGNQYERGYALAADPAGGIWVTGRTASPNFPTTTGAYDTSFNGQEDFFVTRIVPSGNGPADLAYSTFIGGSNTYDNPFGIAVDGCGKVYVAGYAFAFNNVGNYPTTPGAYDTTFGGGEYDAVVSKLAPNGQGQADLMYSTYIGGDQYDTAYDIAVDGVGIAYITGRSWSPNYPTTPGTYDADFNGGDDVIVSVLNPTGTALVFSSWLGGSYWDWGLGITAAPGSVAWVTGATWSYDYPTSKGAFDTLFSGTPVFNSSAYDVNLTAIDIPQYGDADGDDDVDLADLAALVQCMAGPLVAPPPNCSPGADPDFTDDDRVDAHDIAVLQQVFGAGL